MICKSDQKKNFFLKLYFNLSYAPSLKNLRQVAIVFQCQAISTHRLAERLKNVN